MIVMQWNKTALKSQKVQQQILKVGLKGCAGRVKTDSIAYKPI
jgi:hypothetical protein